jgi:dihydrofolate reductase
MLIGGASLYEQAIGMADQLYITKINAKFSGDAWFPEFSLEDWHEVWREDHQADERNPYNYVFVKYAHG